MPLCISCTLSLKHSEAGRVCGLCHLLGRDRQCPGVWGGFDWQKHLGRRKDKLTCQLLPLKSECYRFLRNKVPFPNSTKHLLFCFSSCSILVLQVLRNWHSNYYSCMQNKKNILQQFISFLKLYVSLDVTSGKHNIYSFHW